MKNKNFIDTKSMSLIALMTALMCILAPLSLPLPFTPIPISLAILVVYFCAYILPPFKASLSILLYLLLGSLGLPIFAGYKAGFGIILGPTGGYLLTYIIITFISSYIFHKFPKNRLFHILAMLISVSICLLCGTLWFSFRKNGVDFIKAFYLCVLPFIPGEIIKIIIACIAGPEIRKRIYNI